jgi:hypothetical protein
VVVRTLRERQRVKQGHGHSWLAVTLEIYSHEDRQAYRDALGRISDALGGSDGQAAPPDGANRCQPWVSRALIRS